MSVFTASYFSSKTCCCATKSSRSQSPSSEHTRAHSGQKLAFVHVQRDARLHVWGGSPLTQKFCEKLFALRPLLFRLTVRSPVVASRRPDSAANYVYIDAVRGSSVTRRTLLSY